MADIEKIRKTLHQLKPKSFSDFKEGDDGTIENLDEILDEYKTIARLAKDLVKLPGKDLQEALTTQSSEYHFFRMCVGNLKSMVDYFEALIRYQRGTEYKKIRDSEPRDSNDRAINSLIDSKPHILEITFNLLKVKEVHDRYAGIVESYNQRGYSLNNITKAFEIAVMEAVL